MKDRPLWNSIKELGFQIGDMHGEWEKSPGIPPKLVEKSQVVPPREQPPVERKHITRNGK